MKAELRKQFKSLYTASAKGPSLLTVPALPFVVVDGEGDPQRPEFQDAIGALYGALYTLKFTLKKSRPARDFDVMPLEGLWWCEGMSGFDMNNKDIWRWTLMIQLPDFVTKAMLKEAIEQLVTKRGRTPALGKLRVAKVREGRCVQMLHIGAYDKEAPTLAAMDEFIRAQGFERNGKHHEIYLSDPRRTPAEKLKTILRVPVRKAGKTQAAEA